MMIWGAGHLAASSGADDGLLEGVQQPRGALPCVRHVPRLRHGRDQGIHPLLRRHGVAAGGPRRLTRRGRCVSAVAAGGLMRAACSCCCCC